MKKQQEQDRKALQDQHREENAMLSQQHIGERLGQHESFRAEELAEAKMRLGGRQGMAAVQAAAIYEMRARAQPPSGFKDIPSDPKVAAAYMARAAFREKLLRERDGRNAERRAVTMKAAETHCKNCQAGFVWTTTDGKTFLMCLINQQPVPQTLASCNKYKRAIV